MRRTYSKGWCKGFCTLCGTGCAEHSEDIHELRAQVAALTGALEEIRPPRFLEMEVRGKRDECIGEIDRALSGWNGYLQNIYWAGVKKRISEALASVKGEKG